jgi:hypothetical protein
MVQDTDPPSGSAHEMQDLSTGNTYDTPHLVPSEAPEKRRVRINSSAAEIPQALQASSHNQVNYVDASTTDPDVHAVEADELLRAHQQQVADSEPSARQEPALNDDYGYGYGYSGNTQGGVFYQLLQAYKTPSPALPASSTNASITPPTRLEAGSRPGSSGVDTPRKKKWYEQEKSTRSQETLATLVGAAAELANPQEGSQHMRRAHKRTASNPIVSMIWKAKEEQDAKIKIHVASLLKRQQYIVKMCRALMLFGAPTHRLEEYLAMTAKVLEINSQFLYIPGCMLISFDDVLTRKSIS